MTPPPPPLALFQKIIRCGSRILPLGTRNNKQKTAKDGNKQTMQRMQNVQEMQNLQNMQNIRNVQHQTFQTKPNLPNQTHRTEQSNMDLFLIMYSICDHWICNGRSDVKGAWH